MARGMGSPRHVDNRRRRTREGPNLRVCEHLCSVGWRMQVGMMKHPAVVPSSWHGKNLQLVARRRTGLPARETGRHVVIDMQSSSHSMDPGVSVQKQNFTRNPEKLAKVPGTREETKSHLHRQFLGIRQSL